MTWWERFPVTEAIGARERETVRGEQSAVRSLAVTGRAWSLLQELKEGKAPR